MPVQIRISRELKELVKEIAEEQGLYISDWVSQRLEEILASGFPPLLHAPYVQAMLSSSNDRMILYMEQALLRSVDRQARKEGLTRSNYLLLAMVAGATER
jgi:antitoxin component of RelBE/YafQ-DinJ toxin-antitoxin module